MNSLSFQYILCKELQICNAIYKRLLKIRVKKCGIESIHCNKSWAILEDLFLKDSR